MNLFISKVITGTVMFFKIQQTVNQSNEIHWIADEEPMEACEDKQDHSEEPLNRFVRDGRKLKEWNCWQNECHKE